MVRTATFVLLAAMLAGCAAPRPTSITLGERCERCSRPIDNADIAAEKVAPNGWPSKFRTVHCMATWIGKQGADVPGQYFVTDFRSHKWVRAERAYFVRVIVNDRTMERDFIAFSDQAAADAAAQTNKSTVVKWNDVLALGKSEPLPGN